MAGGKSNPSERAEKEPRDPITSKGRRPPAKIPVASANRVFSVSGPKVPIGSGSGLSAARGIRVIQGD